MTTFKRQPQPKTAAVNFGACRAASLWMDSLSRMARNKRR